MKRKNVKQKIKEYFFMNPTKKLRVRQIELEVEVALPSAIRYSRELEEEGILTSYEVAGVHLYSADRSSSMFLLEKKLFNYRTLAASDLIDFLVGYLSNPSIVVFGSYSLGEDIESSDIDLYIETSSKKKIDLKAFEKEFGRKIQVFVYNNIKKVRNKELANNIMNGMLLHGYLEVF